MSHFVFYPCGALIVGLYGCWPRYNLPFCSWYWSFPIPESSVWETETEWLNYNWETILILGKVHWIHAKDLQDIAINIGFAQALVNVCMTVGGVVSIDAESDWSSIIPWWYNSEYICIIYWKVYKLSSLVTEGVRFTYFTCRRAFASVLDSFFVMPMQQPAARQKMPSGKTEKEAWE